ncbi:MAG: DUF917 domain-containing protein [Chloroflexi bacterium]|nr:DUF917 domain-containing protein [Chloroflexota bacterium]
MPSKTLSDKRQVEDFVHGLTFLGTGGGGGPAVNGINSLMAELEAGRPVAWADIDTLPDDVWTVTVAGMGGRPPKEGPPADELQALGLVTEKYPFRTTLPAAVNELAAYKGVKISAVIPIELGSGNTPGPMVVANQLGIPTIDGDYAGRAIPELTNLKPEIFGVPIAPMAFVDKWGDIVLVRETASTEMADRIGRMLCLGAYSGVGIACYLLQVRDARRYMVSHTLSKSLMLGAARRRALETGLEPVEPLARAAGGWVLFRGEVAEAEWENRGGFMFGYGTHHLKGVGPDSGHTCKVWYKNEHHIMWIDGSPCVTSPDIIALVDAATGEALPNNVIAAGQHLAVIGTPVSDPAYRTDAGLAILAPKHFGFDIPYVPIEDVVGRRKA